MTFYQLPEQHIRNGRIADRPATIGAIGWGYVANDEPALYIAGDDMQWHKVGGSDGASLGDGAAIYKALSGNTLQFRSLKTSANGITVTQNANDVTLALAALNASLLTAGTVDIARLPTITVAKGGTGGTTALQARTNLGLLIGTDVQAHSTNLDGWAALSTSAKANTVHTHAASDVVSGALATARGGTGTDNSTGAAGQILVRSTTDGVFAASGGITVDTGTNINSGILRLDRVSQPLISWLISGTTTAILRLVNGSNQFAFQDGSSNSKVVIDYSTGAMGIYGIESPAAAIDVAHAGTNAFAVIAGADINASTRTDANRKFMRFGIPHYTNAEEPFSVMSVDADASVNRITIGGGTSAGNAATGILFNTASNTTTPTGTTVLALGSGTIGFYGATPVVNPTWGAVSGTISRATFDTGTVTLAQLAQRVGRIIEDLRTVGLFKT